MTRSGPPGASRRTARIGLVPIGSRGRPRWPPGSVRRGLEWPRRPACRGRPDRGRRGRYPSTSTAMATGFATLTFLPVATVSMPRSSIAERRSSLMSRNGSSSFLANSACCCSESALMPTTRDARFAQALVAGHDRLDRLHSLASRGGRERRRAEEEVEGRLLRHEAAQVEQVPVRRPQSDRGQRVGELKVRRHRPIVDAAEGASVGRRRRRIVSFMRSATVRARSSSGDPRLVRRPRANAPVPRPAGSLRDPGVGGDGAADPDLASLAAVGDVHGGVPDRREPCRGPNRRRPPRVARSRLQPARAQSPTGGARHRLGAWRTRSIQSRRASPTAGCRAIHGPRRRRPRIRAGGRAGRHERPPRPRQADRGRRHDPCAGPPIDCRSCGASCSAGGLDARADGPWRDGLPPERAALRRVSRCALVSLGDAGPAPGCARGCRRRRLCFDQPMAARTNPRSAARRARRRMGSRCRPDRRARGLGPSDTALLAMESEGLIERDRSDPDRVRLAR